MPKALKRSAGKERQELEEGKIKPTNELGIEKKQMCRIWYKSGLNAQILIKGQNSDPNSLCGRWPVHLRLAGMRIPILSLWPNTLGEVLR